ncbi:MAG TPA: hypothetical protein VIQ76_13505 [Propionibacteriaceae bacterium]
MVGRTRSHSEERWALLPETIIRCNATRPNGGRCKREAEDGAVVCDQHGGAAPQVRRRAAERLIMSADRVSQKLLEWLDDPEVPYRVRAEIAQDVLDRAGLIATQVHQIIPTTEDPIMRFFKEAFSDPSNREENPPQPAIEERVIDRSHLADGPVAIVEAEIVEPEGEPANDTPPRVAEMIKSGAFDRKPGQ